MLTWCLSWASAATGKRVERPEEGFALVVTCRVRSTLLAEILSLASPAFLVHSQAQVVLAFFALAHRMKAVLLASATRPGKYCSALDGPEALA